MLSRKITVGTLLKWLAGLAAAGAAVAAIVVFFGFVPVSARPPHMALTTEVLHTVFKQSVAARADEAPPADFGSEGRVRLGAQHYANVCARCHGGAELGQNPIALSMRPRPQHLPAVVDQFTDPELFVILRDGVRFSAMPAWPATGNTDEIWSLVSFLRALPAMDGETYTRLTALGPEAPEMDFAAPEDLRPVDVGIKAPPMEEYFYAAPATGWPDLGRSGTPVAYCAGCHGADGSGRITGGHAPNLTLQTAEYLQSALSAYATGARQSGIMQVVAAALSPDQIEALATYYDGLPDVTTDTTATAEQLATGQRIATLGKPEVAVAACLGCHQSDGETSAITVPRIAGQNATYLETALTAYARGDRGQIGRYNPMPHEAGGLTGDEIGSVAAYLASLDPGTRAADAVPGPVPDPANGQRIAGEVCARCHTAAGMGSASGEFPNLTLQGPDYLAQQLHSFRAGQRDSERMLLVSQELSESEITDLAAYFGNGPALPSAPRPDPATEAQIAAGAAIARAGTDGAPACLSCHAGRQTDSLPLIPRLHGQNAGYLQARLDHFARPSSLPLPGLNPMHDIAAGLTEDERAEVAAWFAAQAPLPK